MSITSNDVINRLVDNFGGDDHAKHWNRQALLALVRLAQAEQLFQMKKDVKASIGSAPVGK
jgi:hypothetical protein